MLSKSIYWLTLYFLSILLSSCSHLQGPQPAQKKCIISCQYQLKRCNQICFKNCTNCCYNSKLHAYEFHNRYIRQSKIQGKPAISRLQSFDDPLKCMKNSCDCQADFLLCKQHCLDKIQKRLKIYKFC